MIALIVICCLAGCFLLIGLVLLAGQRPAERGVQRHIEAARGYPIRSDTDTPAA